MAGIMTFSPLPLICCHGNHCCIVFPPLQAPPKTERNGVIVRYDIYYRKTKVEEGANMTLDPFIKANHTPFNLSAESHWVRLGGLEGGRRYEVMISAATRVGVGPNSTLVTTETLEREHTIVCNSESHTHTF